MYFSYELEWYFQDGKRHFENGPCVGSNSATLTQKPQSVSVAPTGCGCRRVSRRRSSACWVRRGFQAHGELLEGDTLAHTVGITGMVNTAVGHRAGDPVLPVCFLVNEEGGWL